MAGLSQVAAGGGTPRATTVLNVAQGDNSHWWPLFLPDRVHFLYLVRSTDDARRGVYLGRIDRSPSESDAFLFRSSSEAVYASMPGGSDGVLFYSVDGRIEVRRFNARSLAVSPDARAIDISAGNGTLFHPLMLSASSDVLALRNRPRRSGTGSSPSTETASAIVCGTKPRRRIGRGCRPTDGISRASASTIATILTSGWRISNAEHRCA